MKSITNQYRDLKEGKLSQFNFMRNLRMTFPQFITNTTSFDDSIKILKNKGLLSEGNNINELSPQAKYNALMKARDKADSSYSSDSKYRKFVKQGNKFAQEVDPVLKKTIEDFGKSLGFQTSIEKGTNGDKFEPIVQLKMGKDIRNPEVKVVITKNSDQMKGIINLPDESAERKLFRFIKQIQQKELDVELKKDGIAENSSNDLQSIFLKYVEDPNQASEYVELFNKSKFDELPDFLVANLQNDEEFNDLMQISKYEDEEKGKEAVMSQFDENLEYDQHDLEQVKALAKEISSKEGVVQHVNRIGKNKYEISDWYDSGTTIISFEDGKIFNDYSDEYEGNRDEEYVDSFGGKMFDNEEDDDNYDTWSDAIKEGSDKKPKLTAAQVNPVELRMGIKIEMEHTDDLKKAEKIALDHLSENPVYYTMLHLSGIEATTAPKVKEEKPKKKKKESIELVDKTNQMKKVKIVKEAVDEVPNDDDSGFQQFKAEKEKEKRVMQATNSQGVTFSVNDIAVAPDGKEIKIVGFTKGKDGKMKASYDEGMYIDVYNLDDLKKKDSFKSGVNLGSSFDKFKSKLKEIVREVINEIEK